MPKRLVTLPRSTGAAAAACLAAAGFLVAVLWWSDQPVQPVPSAPATGQATAEPAEDTVPGFALNPSEDYAEMIERPLFARTRRPTPTDENRAGGAGNGEDAAAAQIALNGVLLIGKRRVALLRIDNDPKVMHVSEGQEAGGWLVETIRADRVVLRRGEVANEIALDFKRKPAAHEVRQAAPRPDLSHAMPAEEDDAGE